MHTGRLPPSTSAAQPTVKPGIGNLKKVLDGFSGRGPSEIDRPASAYNLMKIH